MKSLLYTAVGTWILDILPFQKRQLLLKDADAAVASVDNKDSTGLVYIDIGGIRKAPFSPT